MRSLSWRRTETRCCPFKHRDGLETAASENGRVHIFDGGDGNDTCTGVDAELLHNALKAATRSQCARRALTEVVAPVDKAVELDNFGDV